MSSEPREEDQPNEFGFAGGATAPEPEPDRRSSEEIDGERIAVPSGDLTGPVVHALEETIAPDDEKPDTEKPDDEKAAGEQPNGENAAGEQPNGEKAASQNADGENADSEQPAAGEQPGDAKAGSEQPAGDTRA